MMALELPEWLCFHPRQVTEHGTVMAPPPPMELYPACGVPRPSVKPRPWGTSIKLSCPDCGQWTRTAAPLTVPPLSLCLGMPPGILSITHKEGNSTGGEK